MLNDRELQIVANQALYEILEEHGDACTQVREIDHWASFNSAHARGHFVESCLAAGFFLRGTADPLAPTEMFRAQIWHRDVPADEAMDRIAPFLFDLAAEAGGFYEGWDTAVLV